MMKTVKFRQLKNLSILFLLFSCVSKKTETKQEIYMLPIGYHGYCAVFYGNNYQTINDSSNIRVFHFDSSGIIFTKLQLNEKLHNELFLRKNKLGFDTVKSLLLPYEKITENTIYTSRIQTISQLSKTKDVVMYVFYVGIPSSDPAKEQFLFERKLDSIAKRDFFTK